MSGVGENVEEIEWECGLLITVSQLLEDSLTVCSEPGCPLGAKHYADLESQRHSRQCWSSDSNLPVGVRQRWVQSTASPLTQLWSGHFFFLNLSLGICQMGTLIPFL